MDRYVIYIGWDGCGTTAARKFFGTVGGNLGWSTTGMAESPVSSVAQLMKNDDSLHNIWNSIIKNELLYKNSRAVSGWPYSLLYEQIDLDSDINAVFVHGYRNVETWAYNEIGYQYVRNIPLLEYHDFVNYIYTTMVDENSSISDWQIWIDRYKRHNTEVEEYFSDKTDRFLSVNLDNTTNRYIGEQITNLMGIT